MGLYGALVVGRHTGAACPAGQQAAYDTSPAATTPTPLLLFSEIDPLQNQRAAAASAAACREHVRLAR